MATVEDILSLAQSYVGTKEYSDRHKEILNVYNSHKPLARGYKVQLDDAWCMTFISFLFIKANAVSCIGKTECGCQEYVNYARVNGMTVKEPQKGDLIFYDWGCDGHIDHVGIIYLVSGNMLYVYEGNRNDSVSTRVIGKNAPTVKCFVRPKYNSVSTRYDMNKLSFADSFNRNIAGTYECIASDFVALRYNPYVEDSERKSNKIAEIKNGELCQNYGYYTNDWLLVVYKGKTGFANKNWLRRI